MHVVVTYVGLAAVWVFLMIVIVLHILPNTCNPLRHGIRGYSAGGLRVPTVIAFLLFGIGIGLLDVVAVASIGGGKRVAAGVFFFAVFAAGQVLLGLIPAGNEDAEPTAAGRLGAWITVLADLSAFVAVIAATPTFNRVERWMPIYSTMSRIELAVVVFSILLAITWIKPLRVVHGLVDRLFYLSNAAWFVVLGLHFLKLA